MDCPAAAIINYIGIYIYISNVDNNITKYNKARWNYIHI